MGGEPTGIADVIRWASKLGRKVAESENNGDPINTGEVMLEFERRLAEMPRNALGGFYIFGDAAVVAFTQGYIGTVK